MSRIESLYIRKCFATGLQIEKLFCRVV